jgi:hypothetical protein
VTATFFFKHNITTHTHNNNNIIIIIIIIIIIEKHTLLDASEYCRLCTATPLSETLGARSSTTRDRRAGAAATRDADCFANRMHERRATRYMIDDCIKENEN